MIRFPKLLQLEVISAKGPETGEIKTPGETIYLHQGDEMRVEIRGNIMDRITLHTRQGAVVRQFTLNRLSKSKRGSTIAIGRAEDYLDGELVLVVHAYVNARKYFSEYFIPDIKELQEKLDKAVDETGKAETREQLRSIKAGIMSFQPKDYAFLPYIFHWRLEHVGEHGEVKPLPSIAEARRLREENEKLREENERLSLFREKDTLEKNAEILRTENERLKKNNDALQSKQAELTARKTEKEEAVGKMRISVDDLIQQQEDLDSQARKFRDKINAHREKVKQQDEDLRKLKDSLTRIAQDREAFERKEAELTELRKKEEQLEKDRAAAQSRVKGLDESLAGLSEREKELRITLEALKTLEEKKKTLEDARDAFEADREAFIEVLLRECAGKGGSAANIKTMEAALKKMEHWEGLSEQTIQSLSRISSQLKVLKKELDALKWTAQQESANGQ